MTAQKRIGDAMNLQNIRKKKAYRKSFSLG